MWFYSYTTTQEFEMYIVDTAALILVLQKELKLLECAILYELAAKHNKSAFFHCLKER